jgi:hypothetical protein
MRLEQAPQLVKIPLPAPRHNAAGRETDAFAAAGSANKAYAA